MEQSDTPRTDAAEQFVPYFGWQVHADFVRDLERELAAATRERDEARAALSKFVEWWDKDEAGPQYSTPARRESPEGETEWSRWWNEQLALCAQAIELGRAALAATEPKP